MRLRHGYLGLILCLVAVAMLALSPPALGHHKDGHDQGGNSQSRQNNGGEAKGGNSQKDNDGDADNDPNTLQTEETNEPDEGDNRHPSGKDRSVENRTESNPNQGKSEADPDGDSNGGIDKPNGSGGIDLEDQDGNNGCGNDDDFEDDNNGNCGGKKSVATLEAELAADETKVAGELEEGELEEEVDVGAPEGDSETDADVLGETIFAPEVEVDEDEGVAAGAQESSGAPDVAVAAAQPAAPTALPVTGAGAVPLAWLALALILTGTGSVRVSSSRKR